MDGGSRWRNSGEVMEAEEHPDLVASWKAERRGFRRTVGFTVGLCLLLLGWGGAVVWFNHHFESSLAKSGEMNLDQLGPFFMVISVLNLLILTIGLGFIVSLIKWLLAIRRRRMVQAATLQWHGR